MEKLRCLVVDDEDVAIDGIVDYMAGGEYLTLAGRCCSAVEAMKALRERPVDLMFLDINMPRLSGLEMLEALERPPLVILTTAYSEYAVEGFRLQVVDYLLKPYSFARFAQATDRALARHAARLGSKIEPVPEREMYIRQGDTFVRIVPDQIVLVEAMQNYLKLHLADKTYLIHQTMASLEEMLPAERFYRVHNSYLVNVGRIESISGGRLTVAGKEIPLSKHRKEDFMRSVVYKNLVSK